MFGDSTSQSSKHLTTQHETRDFTRTPEAYRTETSGNPITDFGRHLYSVAPRTETLASSAGPSAYGAALEPFSYADTQRFREHMAENARIAQGSILAEQARPQQAKQEQWNDYWDNMSTEEQEAYKSNPSYKETIDHDFKYKSDPEYKQRIDRNKQQTSPEQWGYY